MDFRVDLDMFRGPLDLLLYLVRKHEVEIVDIPIAQITEQYLGYLEVLDQLDCNAVGDFLEMASTLIEIKSREVLPQSDEVDEDLEDPREELVRRLLEYKKFRDAATMLEERSRQWQRRFTRLASDFSSHERNLAEEPIREVELWDLVSAFGRIIRDSVLARPSSIVYDETPIHVYMARIHQRLRERAYLPFAELFEEGMHKSTLVAIFLAVLELVRHAQVRVDQNELFGQIWLALRDDAGGPIDFSQVDNYDHRAADSEPPAVSSLQAGGGTLTAER